MFQYGTDSSLAEMCGRECVHERRERWRNFWCPCHSDFFW